MYTDLQIQLLLLVICLQLTTETAFAQEIHELNSSTCSDEFLELLPPISAVDERDFQELEIYQQRRKCLDQVANSYLCKFFNAFDLRLRLIKSLGGIGGGYS